MEFSMQTAFKYLYILLHSTPSFPEDLTSVFLLLLNLNSLFVPSHMHAFYNTNTRNNLFTSTTSLLSTKLHQYQWHEFESAPLKQAGISLKQKQYSKLGEKRCCAEIQLKVQSLLKGDVCTIS